MILEDVDGEMRSVYSRVGNGSSFGASTLTQEIGVGQAQRIVSLEVRWPATGGRQVFTDVPLDSHFKIREGADRYEILDLPTVPLGLER